MAISFGVAVGLYAGVNVDFDKSNLSKVLGDVGKCVKQELWETGEQTRHHHNRKQQKEAYETQGQTSEEKQEMILCENSICLPPIKWNG